MSFLIKRNDRLPAYACVLMDGSRPADLTGCTVRFKMRARGASVAKVDQPASVVGDPKDGRVEYAWGTGETNVVGSYFAEWTVTNANGWPRTYPNNDFLRVVVVANL